MSYAGRQPYSLILLSIYGLMSVSLGQPINLSAWLIGGNASENNNDDKEKLWIMDQTTTVTTYQTSSMRNTMGLVKECPFGNTPRLMKITIPIGMMTMNKGFMQGISDAIADRSDMDMTQRMLRNINSWPLSYSIGYQLFCQRGRVKGDSYAGFICFALLSLLFMFMAAMFM